ncbi:MAG: hypothetical protein DRQ55_19490, partial [Planctomycetota bacterium]
MYRFLPAFSALLALTLVAACSTDGNAYFDEAADETGVGGPFTPVESEDGSFDVSGVTGPPELAGAASEVWAVTRAWDDVEGEAGIAWAANSGLDWEGKYDAWVASFEPAANADGSGQTFQITTPYGGRSFPAPSLECAEVAFMLRGVFSAWYELPFMIQGWNAEAREVMFAGHFGFVDRRGNVVGRFPNFRTSYHDYRGEWTEGQPWPSDTRLRGYRLADDDENPFIDPVPGKVAGGGAYFDELLLNKRAGYFLRLLLLYFGSVNLADGSNMFHVQPAAISPGDVLLHRHQRVGTGHTIPVMRVREPAEGRFEADVATGNIPRRQPKWEASASAKTYFVDNDGGGTGDASDGTPLAKLGGGLRRFRTARLVDGRWRNTVRVADREFFIDDGNLEAVAARPMQFEEIMAEVPPDQQREVAIGQIEDARNHLRMYPSSCSARERREVAFESLYRIMDVHFFTNQLAVDAEFRLIEDYVFADLDYEASKTCCWNGSTSAMHEIIMDYAAAEQTAAGMCMVPTPFMNEGMGADGYERWRAHAASIGRGAEWVAWSEGEPCAWRDVTTDTLAPALGIAYCDLADAPPPLTCDPEPTNNDAASATPLTEPIDALICADDEDWFRVEGTGPAQVRVSFRHSRGDLDVEALDLEGGRLAQSTSSSDEELVAGDRPFMVRVFGFSSAS